MPATRASKKLAPSRTVGGPIATKIPVANTRKRGVSPSTNSTGPLAKHRNCKRTALGDITNLVLKDTNGAEKNKQPLKKKTAKAAAFTVFEENTVPNIFDLAENESEGKPFKPSNLDYSDVGRTSSPPKANLDIIKEDPENQITTSKPDAAIVAPVIIKKDLTVEGQDWIDIDADTTDPAFAPEYAADIFENLRDRELHFMVGDYLANQPEITVQMRCILIDWLVEVQETFELYHETLYLAVRMVDRYLNIAPVRKLHLQLVGVTAIFLAAKMEEKFPPPLDDFIFVCDRAYNEEEILKMERLICSKLEYEVYMPVSYSFLRRYGKCVSADMPLLTLGRYALELSLQDYVYTSYRPSQLAAAALSYAMQISDHGEWNKTLEHYTHYKQEELQDIVKMLNASAVSASKDERCQTIFKKYSHQVFFKVALQTPLDFTT